MINLHLHTAFSLLDSISMPDTVAERVAELGQEAVAITEHGNIYSHIKHYKACKEQGIKAIIGSEMYITEDLSKKDSDSRYYHLVVLAKNNTGLTNLIDMINLSTKEENFYYKPRIDFNILKEHSEGLIILSACLGSQVMKTIEKYVNADKEAEKLALEWKEMQTQELSETYTAKQKGLDIDSSGYKDNLTQYNEDTQHINSKYEGLIVENTDKLKAKYWNKARDIALQYKEVFGEDYYLEYQSHADEQQQVQNRLLVDLAKELDISYVVTADAHYIKESDQDTHSMWVKVGTAREAGETYNDCYIQDDEDVYRICKSTTQEENSIAIENTHKIAEKCDVEIKLSPPIMPHIPIPKEFNSEFEYITKLCLIGWKDKELDKLPSEQKKVYKDRLKYELSALNDMGFVGYMLLVRDIVGQLNEKGVGRGSSAGSLVSYLLDITGIDPIQYDLFFERFIDVGQLEAIKQGTIDPMDIKVPDVDTDISQEGRLKAYNYIQDTYGVEHFAMVGSFGYVKAKNAIKDTVRAMGLDISLGERLSQLIPDGSNETLKELVDIGTFDEYKDSSKVQEVLKYATQFYGLPRSVGIHPSAVVITNKTMNNYSSVRINKDNNQPVLDLDQYDAEDVGLVKIDLLGLRTIDLYYEVLRELEKQGIKFNEDEIDYSRDDVYAMFKTGNTELLFQFESTGMQDALATIQPNSIDELAMANALYRPGSMRYIDVYGRRLRGEEEVTYIHPDLEEILKPTLGILVFQEQLISIGRLANMKNADDIRVATAKKKIDMMQRVKPELFRGLKARGWTENQLNSLWNTIIEFASYSLKPNLLQ